MTENSAKLEILRRGHSIARGTLNSAWIPLNIDLLLTLKRAMVAVAKTGSITYFVLPRSLRPESATRPVPKRGDILLMPQHSALGVALEDSDPPPFPAIRAGRLEEGLDAVAQLRPGDIVILIFSPAEE